MPAVALTARITLTFAAGAPALWAGALAGLAGVVMAFLVAQPRIFLAMARDGMLPRWTARVHPRFGTPVVTTLVTGGIVGLSSAFVPIEDLARMQSVGTLFAFVLVCGGVLVLRCREPNLPRPYRAPCMPWVAILGMITCFGLMINLPATAWIRLFVWMAIGLAIYFGFGYRRSRLRNP